MDHDHRHHPDSQKQQAKKQQDQLTEKPKETALHGHAHAIPKDTSGHPPHDGHAHSGHGEHGHDHHRMMIEDFKKRFWISLVLSIPVIILSPMVQHILSFTLDVPYSMYIAFMLSSIIYFYGGWPFLTGLVEEVKKGAPGMMTLIGVAITVAYLYSSAIVFGLGVWISSGNWLR
ncbi:cation transport ATPase [Pontibacter sp. HSC-36F09]|nr:cation transport ATPase [Pontibacter sp. HSC-36F09]